MVLPAARGVQGGAADSRSCHERRAVSPVQWVLHGRCRYGGGGWRRRCSAGLCASCVDSTALRD